MSGEQITVKEISNAAKIDNVREKLPPKFENRVNINELLSKVRKEKKTGKKRKLYFPDSYFWRCSSNRHFSLTLRFLD